MTAPEQSPAPAGENTQEFRAISERLLAARLNAEPLQAFPGKLPSTLDDAYAIQSDSMRRWPDAVGGWKVGMVPEQYRADLAAQRLAGPIFAPSIVTTKPNSITTMPIFDGGFAAIEAEFVLELATDVVPIAREYSDDELIELFPTMYVGAEIASSPMAMVNKLGPCCVVSDFGNNAGLIVGSAVPEWSSLSPNALTATVTVDDVVVGKASAAAIEGGLLQVLRYLIVLCADRGLPLPKGSLVSSGAVTGIHEVSVDSKATVDFRSFGALSVEFESMRPRQ